MILGSGFNRVGIGAFKGTDGAYPKHLYTAVFTHTCCERHAGAHSRQAHAKADPEAETPKPSRRRPPARPPAHANAGSPTPEVTL